MSIEDINKALTQLAGQATRENVLEFSYSLLEWMGIEPTPNKIPRLLGPKTQTLKDYLFPAPITAQAQLYRLNAEDQSIRVRFAVLKKLKKEYVTRLVDSDPGLTSFQSTSDVLKPITKAPYFLHFVTTPDYDRLVLIFNQGGQKRIVTFRKRLTNTQYNRIIQPWQGIALKSKPEIADIFWRSLDIKEVNKEFYAKIKERFDALAGMVKTEYSTATDIQTKQFTVRLIGRYVFCWFLKEKETIPLALISKSTIENTPDYYQNSLLKLFFETLNTKVQDRNPLTHEQLFEKIPYLNGGLFDISEEDRLFQKINLDKWLIPFVEILESYDFTIDESSSNYQQIAIDPEMLGRIFENLLASQNKETEKLANDRKAFGAFYTPREIVDYMVNISLKSYLETHLLPVAQETAESNIVAEPLVAYKSSLFRELEPQQTMLNLTGKEIAAKEELKKRRERLKEKIERLFSPGCSDNPFDKDESPLVRKALSEVKILDPACGSGAFPMGVLLRLMELRQIVGHGHKNTYELKNEILSKNIFGVDIMPMAIEIARLRAWLSLVLEADYKPADRKNNFGIAALPNLDFKFICANTLIDSGYDAFVANMEKGWDRAAALFRLAGEIEKLETLRNQYFDPKGDKQIKEQLQKDFTATKKYIKTEFNSLKKSWNLEDFLNKVDDWDPFDDSKPSSFFSPAWMFGIKDGFDIVIGNPPYIQMQKDGGRLAVMLKDGNYKTYERMGDVYAIFYERGYQLLKPNAYLVYITSNKWMRAGYGESLRKFFTENINPVLLIDFAGQKIFEGATVDTNVLLFQRGKNGNPTQAAIVKEKIDNNLSDIVHKTANSTIFSTSDSWVILSPIEQRIKEKIEHIGTPLKDWNIQINYGIKTGCNEAFIIPGKIKDELIAQDPKSAEIIRPILRGRDIKKYGYEFADLWLINTHNGLKEKGIYPINIKAYPAIKTHLNKYYSELEKRADKGDTPYNLRNCVYMEDFFKQKIIFQEMVQEPSFSLDEEGKYMCLDTARIITGENLDILLAVLNSKIFFYAVKQFYGGGGLGEKGIRMKHTFFEYFPMPTIIAKDISILRMAIKEPSKTTLNQIDTILYAYYRLNKDEVDFIDFQLT